MKGPVWVEEHDLFDDCEDDQLLKESKSDEIKFFLQDLFI